MTRIEVVTVMVLFCLATYFMSDIRAGRIEKRKNEKRICDNRNSNFNNYNRRNSNGLYKTKAKSK